MSPDRIEALSRRLADPTSRRSVLGLFGAGVAGTAVAAVGLFESEALRQVTQQRERFGRRKRRQPPLRGHRGRHRHRRRPAPRSSSAPSTLKKFKSPGNDQIYALGKLAGDPDQERQGQEGQARRTASPLAWPPPDWTTQAATCRPSRWPAASST